MKWRRMWEEEPEVGKEYIVFTKTGKYAIKEYAEGWLDDYNKLADEEWPWMVRKYGHREKVRAFRSVGGWTGQIVEVLYFMELPKLPITNESERLRAELYKAHRKVKCLEKALKNEQQQKR